MIADRAFSDLVDRAHRVLLQSLAGPCHRPSGTEASPPITPASPISALTISAADILHLLVSSFVGALLGTAGATPHVQAMPLNRHTPEYVVSVPIEFHEVANVRSAGAASAVHDCAHLVDADRTNLMLTSPSGHSRVNHGYGNCG